MGPPREESMMDLSHEHGPAPKRTLERASSDAPTQAPRADPIRLSALWTELVSGLCKIEQTLFSEQSCALVVTRSPCRAGGPAPLPPRYVEVLERALIDGARKSVASDLGLCPSSIAEILKRGSQFMGLSCWPSRIPLVLTLSAHASRAPELSRAAAALVADNQQFQRQTVSVARPDDALAARLTPAEFAVTRLLIEGKSYAEMAAERRTSARTVANQLATAFSRLGVSGRAELVCLLAERTVASWQLSTPARRISLTPIDPATGFARIASWQPQTAARR
jgi:DNA-binding CsgD family transcriptional regulator